MNDDDDDDDEEDYIECKPKANGDTPSKIVNQNAMYRTGTNSSSMIVQDKYPRCFEKTLERKHFSTPLSQSLPALKSSSSSCSII